MKQPLLLVLAGLNGLLATATIRTVSNNPGTTAQFNTIQAAVNASADGDSIYVHGSPNTYAAFDLNKRLTIIGPGWSPDKNLPHQAVVQGGVNYTTAAATGTEMQGLNFTSSTISIAVPGIQNLRFVRNRFAGSFVNLFPNVGGITLSGYLFEGNWFDNSLVQGNSSYTYQNFLFQNNLFIENGCCVGGNIAGFTNTVNVLVDHNLFYGPGSGARDAFANNCRFLLVTNNVFVRRNAAASLSSSTFNNNITFNAGNDAPWTANGNVNGGGNVAGTDPQMADQAAVNGGTNNPLLDFSIAAGPANNAGSDGKDMGLLFDATGSLNWVASRNSRLPRIFSMNITTPTVAQGGNLSVTVEARRSN